MTGIYQITNTVTREFYIGLATDIDKRWYVHLAKLRAGRHHAVKLQASYNEHGAGAFVMNVVQICSEAQLLDRETYWILTLRPSLNTAIVNLPATRDIAGLIKQRSVERTFNRHKRVADMQGKPGECCHCESMIHGRYVCPDCGEWLKDECQDCHDELAHDRIPSQSQPSRAY